MGQEKRRRGVKQLTRDEAVRSVSQELWTVARQACPVCTNGATPAESELLFNAGERLQDCPSLSSGKEASDSPELG